MYASDTIQGTLTINLILLLSTVLLLPIWLPILIIWAVVDRIHISLHAHRKEYRGEHIL